MEIADKFIITIHDLMKNPKDVPPDSHWVLNENALQTYYEDGKWYDWSDDECYECPPPKLWYSVPEFNIERRKLEKMSKEELIDLILKERKERLC